MTLSPPLTKYCWGSHPKDVVVDCLLTEGDLKTDTIYMIKPLQLRVILVYEATCVLKVYEMCDIFFHFLVRIFEGMLLAKLRF